jgi:hypothetical protein
MYLCAHSVLPIWMSPDSLIKARDSGGLDIPEVSLSFSNRDIIYSCLTVPFSLAFFTYALFTFFPLPPLIPIAPLVLLSFSNNSTPYSYNFCCSLPTFWNSHSLSSARILFDFCWPMLIIVTWTKICVLTLFYCIIFIRIYIFPYRNKGCEG